LEKYHQRREIQCSKRGSRFSQHGKHLGNTNQDSIGKMTLPAPLQELVKSQQEQNGIQILPITQDHIYVLADLPHHGDPFDRMLIAQAQHEGLTFVTADEKIAKYAVETTW
jgi:PIN domain nuclease of toxin-antitoxin system